MYDEAKKHYEHAIDGIAELSRTQYPKALETDYHEAFKKYIRAAATAMGTMSKDFSASFLSTQCDAEVTGGQFDQARY